MERDDNQLLYTKFDHWAYEEEVRVIVDLKKAAVSEGRLYFFRFSPALRLREVILGHRCTLSLDEIRRFVRSFHPDAVTFQARPAWGSFDLVPEESSVP